MSPLSADDLIYGYINGIFPMADSDGTLYWYSPDPRAIIPIDTYKPAKSLRPFLNKQIFEIRINYNFRAVMVACSQPRRDSDDTWISEEIINAYTNLHQMGFAHSVEAYLGEQLVGGVYGVAIGAAFFGESMFYTEPNASKVAFHALMELLKKQDFELLDTQFINDNVKRFGAIEISKAEYMRMLKRAIRHKAKFVEAEVAHLFNVQTDDLIS
ncbi:MULTISPECIES: leucyl/phenylalanyl-tRNA--protein transferase [Emticicia]|uniref:leucyl/phenylalanyl-tRNA--protein transferase n=1 Tax=Emticicia TaxID=312278 RepID=UPI00209CCAC9|nr:MULTISPECIES: leucyl/phenylalanyl-tRNA--protein transferase [Emticicia]UTA68226.1 leucyl/phenylalanyl-tRNA--protein transferase [Emticicia sp. 21SJ11W-3]